MCCEWAELIRLSTIGHIYPPSILTSSINSGKTRRMDPQLEIEPGKTLHPSYALTRSQSLGGVRSTSAGNYPVIPRTYSITDFAEYRRELIAHPITWPRVPIVRPRVSTYVYRPHWTYRSYWPYNYTHFQCPPGPYEYRNDPYHWAYTYHPHLTKYRTEWYRFDNRLNHRISGAYNHSNILSRGI